ncbi:response regulator transcription factor [Paenibacillus nasutitermitis]|uniref:DNA-binding response regulator n=1 Tax=Paenibacillus nasutitermitis TaxID=1652958 RepID=A0A916YJY9_9BACL|nr:response regulator [Paenibacillus nasutitermitis]GGD49324.1 DNA-binding response regulator [Paenibacillus nasutitermitis]
MFQILIVDDHEHLVESLARSLPWDELGIEQVHKAYSGSEALNLLDTYPIQIVITDIRMPGMSGLELIERIRQKHKRIKSILLSGYAEFEYAKQAIQSHTVDYILKPAEDEEIIASLRKATEAICKEWEEVSSHQRTLYTLRENVPKLKDNLLNELLRGRSLPKVVLAQQLESFEIPFSADDEVTMMLVRLDESFFAYSRHDFYLLEYAIGNMAEEIFGDEYELWTCRDANDYLVFLIKERAVLSTDLYSGENSLLHRPLKLEREASELQNCVRSFLQGSISVLISSKGSFPREIPMLYQSSLRLIRQRFGGTDEFLISADSFSNSQTIDSSTGLYDSPTLVQLLEAGRYDAIDDKLHTVFESIGRSNRQTYQEHIMEVCFAVASALIYISHKNSKQLEAVIGEDFSVLLQAIPFRNVGQLQMWVSRVLGKVKADMNSEQGETAAYLIRRAQEYVEDHLSEDTSLQAVADFVHLHPVYLSRVYKSETGEGLSGYILRLKMEKAEKLLLESSKKIHEIAEQLGYENPPYFIKVFKKYFGWTPKEFRDQNAH